MRASVGLVPVAFDRDRRRVRLLDLRDVDFDGPVFRHSIERLRARHPDAPLLHLGMDELLAASRDEPRVPPAGLIFHTPRSGSTLLANMLGAPAGHVVLKQSLTVNVLLSEIVLAMADPEESRRYQGLLRLDRPTAEALLALTVSRLAGCRQTGYGPDGSPRLGRVILKPTSWAISAASALLRIFPETPAIFLTRDPTAVVASMVSMPPRHPPYTPVEGWPPEALYPFLPSLRQASSDDDPVSFFAHAWRSAAEMALALPRARTLFLDYADLTDDPIGTLDRVSVHFGLMPTEAERAAMREQLGLYSKARSDPEAFDPAGRHHRTPLTDEQKDVVAAIVGDLPMRLTTRQSHARLQPA